MMALGWRGDLCVDVSFEQTGTPNATVRLAYQYESTTYHSGIANTDRRSWNEELVWNAGRFSFYDPHAEAVRAQTLSDPVARNMAYSRWALGGIAEDNLYEFLWESTRIMEILHNEATE